MDSQTSYSLLGDLEEKCSLSSQDLPLFSRLFVHELAGAYYYCAKNRTLLVLNQYQNFTLTGGSISLSNLPAFDEVRIKFFLTRPTVITIIGITNQPNTKDKMAKNYTDSYMILINWQLKIVTMTTKIKGAHGEPIVDMEALFGKVVAVGEKVYDCAQKLNTYYYGNWGDSQYLQVIDFYLTNSLGFIPQIKITTDQQYLIYTNTQSIFGYHFNTTIIIQSQSSTLTTNSFYKDGELAYKWQQMPFTVSMIARKFITYYNGNLTIYSIQGDRQFVKESSIPVAPFDPSKTYSRFYFFKDLLKDKVFVQIGDSTSIVYLSNNEIE